MKMFVRATTVSPGCASGFWNMNVNSLPTSWNTPGRN